MQQLIENHSFILMEGAIVEQLRRSGKVQLHETLVNAPLIYSAHDRATMGTLYDTYIDLAQSADLPILVCTPTWRANKDRVQASDVSASVNQDAVEFLRQLADASRHRGALVKVGGMIGPRNDAYQPDRGLSGAQALDFHSWQIQQLAEAKVDYLIAETLPNVQEALGIAQAMARTDIAYIISFVIGRDGRVLDGSSLQAAMDLIDSASKRRPVGYMVNCAHPSFLCPEQQPSEVFSRLIGYQANASSLDHCDLDQADGLRVDSVTEWGRLMLALNESYGVQILGGCCGTGIQHLQYLVDHRQG